MLKYYNIKSVVLLKKNTKFIDSTKMIGKNINLSMLKSEYLMKYHKEKTHKYVFGNFTPIEKNGIYKGGRFDFDYEFFPINYYNIFK